MPDLTLLLDIDPALGLARATDARRRPARGARTSRSTSACATGFLAIAAAEPERVRVVDADGHGRGGRRARRRGARATCRRSRGVLGERAMTALRLGRPRRPGPRSRASCAPRSTAARVAHAYLFVGPPGAGKKTAASALACALLCDDDGCGACAACYRVRAGLPPRRAHHRSPRARRLPGRAGARDHPRREPRADRGRRTRSTSSSDADLLQRRSRPTRCSRRSRSRPTTS